jgi:hypothetical protein
MNSAIKAACVAAVCIGVAAAVGRGQVDNNSAGDAAGMPGPAAVVVMNQSPPPTRMDAMLATRGAVILRGYTDVGAVQAEDGSGVGVTAVELTDATRGQKEYGLAVGVKRSGRAGVAVQTYLDYDEIDGLSAAMDQLNHLDSTATQLAAYEGRFRTKADLVVANFADNSGARMVSVRAMQVLPESGQVVYATAYFPLARFAEIRQLIAAGKQTIDKARGNSH